MKLTYLALRSFPIVRRGFEYAFRTLSVPSVGGEARKHIAYLFGGEASIWTVPSCHGVAESQDCEGQHFSVEVSDDPGSDPLLDKILKAACVGLQRVGGVRYSKQTRETARWTMMDRWDLQIVVDDVSVSGEVTTR